MALVEQLDLAEGTDTLSRWMAHYVAQLIEEAKAADDNDRGRAEERCAAAILALWERRAALPGRRPFGDHAAIAATLAAIDPASANPFFVNRQRRAGVSRGADPTEDTLQLVEELDRGARLVLADVLAEVAGASAACDAPWVEAATAASQAEGEDVELARQLAAFADLVDAREQGASDADIANLDRLIATAQQLRGRLAGNGN